MKILILNGSPHPNGNTKALTEAFTKGAESAGHEVVEFMVGSMNIKPCLGCDWCHTKGEGKCIQKDEMEKIYEVLDVADMIVFASPVHYLGFTGPLQTTLARFHAPFKPKAAKNALILSSNSPNVFAAIETLYKGNVGFFGAEDMGIKEVVGADNKSEAVLKDLEVFGASLK